MVFSPNSLSRRFLTVIALNVTAVSLLCSAVLAGTYRTLLEQERGQIARELSRLLQFSLENAMLKRDLKGLQNIVDRLGAQDQVRGVMILDANHEIRFSSSTELGTNERTGGLAGDSARTATVRFQTDRDGNEIVRSFLPVRNKPACTGCHGTVADHPINGFLVVDYDAAPIRHRARTAALIPVAWGGALVLLVLGSAWWFLRRFVVRPIGEMIDASRAISGGNLDARMNRGESAELDRLGTAFNKMATNLKQQLTTVEEREAFLQSLLDADPDAVRVIDNDFTVLNANRRYREQSCLAPERAVGSRCFQMSHGRSEPCPSSIVTCPVHEIRANRQPVRAIHRHVRRDGVEYWAEVNAAPMDVEVGGERRTYIVESMRDLSQTAKLSHAQRLSELAQLAAGVAHSIHNPLAAIRLALQSLLRDYEHESTNVDRVHDYLRLMDDQIDHCINITQRLLRLGTTPGSVAELVSMNSIVEETTSLLSYEARELGVEVKTDLCVPEPRVIGFDSELRLLMVNLVQNAFHAMPDGGSLEIRTWCDELRAGIAIRDSGVGIAPEDLPRIFEPFFSHRADGAQGTGLGLTMVKTIVEHNNGRLTVESPPGRGTTFLVTFSSARERNRSNVS